MYCLNALFRLELREDTIKRRSFYVFSFFNESFIAIVAVKSMMLVFITYFSMS
jgi:hypothetical protein